MKALARHPGAAQTLVESDRFQRMFHMVFMGYKTPLIPPSQNREIITTHLAQLYRHVLQVGHFLYIRNHHKDLIFDKFFYE